VSDSGVGIIWWRLPILAIPFSINPLQIMGTLRITITRSILCSNLITRMSSLPTVLFHFNEVKRTIKSTRKLAHIHIKSELMIEQIEHLIIVGIIHEESPWSNIPRVGALSYEAEFKWVTITKDVIGVLVLLLGYSVDSTVLGAGLWVWAKGLLPFVSCVAVWCVCAGFVWPTPITIDCNLPVLWLALTFACALCIGQRWMIFISLMAYLLRESSCKNNCEYGVS
jgi:hypothetical protein